MKYKQNMKLKLFGVIFISSLIMSACSNPLDSLADEINSWFSDSGVTETGSESEDNYSDTATEDDGEDLEVEDYESLQGEGTEIVLEDGEHTVGNDIPAGRYHVTANEGRGNVIVRNDEGNRINAINVVMSADNDFINGSEEMYLFLLEGNVVELHNISVVFTPYNDGETLDTLPTGQYVVGENVEPGMYEVYSDINEGYYTFEVYSESHQERKSMNHFGDPEYGGVTTHAVFLEPGDIIVSSVPSVELTSLD